jgi:hypothetical protein
VIFARYTAPNAPSPSFSHRQYSCWWPRPVPSAPAAGRCSSPRSAAGTRQGARWTGRSCRHTWPVAAKRNPILVFEGAHGQEQEALKLVDTVWASSRWACSVATAKGLVGVGAIPLLLRQTFTSACASSSSCCIPAAAAGPWNCSSTSAMHRSESSTSASVVVGSLTVWARRVRRSRVCSKVPSTVQLRLSSSCRGIL